MYSYVTYRHRAEPFGSVASHGRFLMITAMMNARTVLIPTLLAGVLALAAACGDDDDPAPQAEGPTTLAVEKVFEPEGAGAFTFAVRISNTGDQPVVRIALSDVWEQGIEITEIGDLDGNPATGIGDTGFEVLVDSLAPGDSAEITYTGECSRNGQWTNRATVSAENSDGATTSVSVSCS